MTKNDVINEIFNRIGGERQMIQTTLEEFLVVVKKSLSKGNAIYIRGFGTFQAKKMGRKVARNVKKNTTVIVEERFVPKFKPSKAFSQLIENSLELKKLA